eukprot:868895-Prorocentrum_minimum.AAC.1
MTSATMRAPVRHSSFFFLRSNGIRARSLPGYTLVRGGAGGDVQGEGEGGGAVGAAFGPPAGGGPWRDPRAQEEQEGEGRGLLGDGLRVQQAEQEEGAGEQDQQELQAGAAALRQGVRKVVSIKVCQSVERKSN